MCGTPSRPQRRAVWLFALAMLVGCGPPASQSSERSPDRQADAGSADSSPTDDVGGPDASRGAAPLPYASEVVEFSPGAGAGHGAEEMPGVVLGPPESDGQTKGSLDVVSLGAEGTIVLGFGDRAIVDGEGADFIVFENAFYVGGESGRVWAEVGEVSVSRDGEEWRSFECRPEAGGENRYPGCAGWHPTRDYDPAKVQPLEPALTGGDPFDLSEVGLEKARWVRITDVSKKGGAPSAGFDLDAVGIVHGEALGGPE